MPTPYCGYEPCNAFGCDCEQDGTPADQSSIDKAPDDTSFFNRFLSAKYVDKMSKTGFHPKRLSRLKILGKNSDQIESKEDR
jgi:hypothetical protein